MITDLGMALGLRGTPRDPGLVADTASLMSLARGGLAGPEEGHGRILRTHTKSKPGIEGSAVARPSTGWCPQVHTPSEQPRLCARLW